MIPLMKKKLFPVRSRNSEGAFLTFSHFGRRKCAKLACHNDDFHQRGVFVFSTQLCADIADGTARMLVILAF